MDSFNLPLYFSHVSELKVLIEKNRYFSIERFELLDNPMKSTSINSQLLTTLLRSTLKGVIRVQFGEIIVDKIFEYFAQKFESDPLTFDKDSLMNTELFILLK